MKSRFIPISAAVALGALLIVPLYADTGVVTRPKGKTKSSTFLLKRKMLNKDRITRIRAKGAAEGSVLDKEIIVDPSTRPADSSRLGEVQRAHSVHISQFVARREASGITITAVLGNMASADVTSIHFSVSRIERGRWTGIDEGRTTIPARGKRDFSWPLPATNEQVKLRLDVTTDKPFAQSTKYFTLQAVAEESHVLVYGTNGWVLAYERKGEVDTNKLRGDEAHKRAARLTEFGFETKISRKTNTGPFTDTEIVRLWVRITASQERTFGTVEEALEFARMMKSFIRDRDAVWSRVDPE